MFGEVKGAAYPSTALDIEYMRNVAHEGRTNPFDFMTPCGFGPFVCKKYTYIQMKFSNGYDFHLSLWGGCCLPSNDKTCLLNRHKFELQDCSVADISMFPEELLHSACHGV